MADASPASTVRQPETATALTATPRTAAPTPVLGFVAPADLAQSLVKVGIGKAALPMGKMIILGMLAGIYIGFAAHLATTVCTGWGGEFFGLMKFFTGAVFSVGRMLVVIAGSELFTGNNLLTVALLNGDITMGKMLRNWVVVFLANFAGSILLAAIIWQTGLINGTAVGDTAVKIAAAKAPLAFGPAFFRGIACNWLVCLAVMMMLAAKDIVGKIFGAFFPIMAFVAMGFEHSVANMYFLTAGYFAKGAVTADYAGKTVETINWGNILVTNLLPVTLGNTVGGALLVGAVYWFVYVRGTRKA